MTAAVLTKLGAKVPGEWPTLISTACARYGITTKLRMAAFLANIINETGALTTFTEGLNYSVAGLMATWPSRFPLALAQVCGRTATQAAKQPLIAELAYAGRMGNREAGWGDGWAYRGRGAIQTTGKANYADTGKEFGLPLEAVGAFLESPAGAMLSAAWFVARAGVLPMADKGDIRSVRSVLNVGHVVGPGEDAKIIGLEHVTALYRTALGAL